jgi:hypothetical protein
MIHNHVARGSARLVLALVLLLSAAAGVMNAPHSAHGQQRLSFEYSTIAQVGGRTAIGDIDGDGRNDIVVHTWSSRRGLEQDGRVTWYKNPSWQEFVIRDNDHLFGDGVIIVDLDGDGDNDVVTSKGNDGVAEVWWFENQGGSFDQPWPERLIATAEKGSETKDLEVDDIDHDGKLDVVVRTKHYLSIFFQETPDRWTANRMENREREGMTAADVDGDGDQDMIMNGFWRENPDNPREDTWPEHVIDPQWFTDVTGGWQDHSVMAGSGDINGDGRVDIVLGHSEKTGFHVTWYQSDNPTGGAEAWKKHPIHVVDYCHSVCVGDLDLDGDHDIVAGTLIRTDQPEIVVLINQGQGETWSSHTVASKSAYKAKIGDVDGDGDLDIVTALSWEEPPIQLLRNQVRQPGVDNQE